MTQCRSLFADKTLRMALALENCRVSIPRDRLMPLRRMAADGYTPREAMEEIGFEGSYGTFTRLLKKFHISFKYNHGLRSQGSRT